MTHEIPRARLLRAIPLALAGAALLLGGLCAHADTWPSKPVRLVVSYPPGGTVDAVARIVAPKLSAKLGQPVVIDNRGGAGGAIGGDLVVKSPADGYTVLLDASNHAQNPALRKMPFDTLRELAPVSLLVRVPNVLVVNPSAPFKSVADLIAQAKAKPGGINYASSGNGSAQHLAGELFASMAGVQMTHVAYKGGGPALTDVMSGHVPVFFASLASSLPFIKDGKLRPLAVTGKAHAPALPQLPTVAEAGLPGYEVYEWNAVFVPAGTPAPVVERLSKEFAATLKDPEVRGRLEALGAEVIGSSPAELDGFRRAEIAKWTKLAKDNKIQLD
ncbi:MULTISPECIES: tripartite tricarboxylate transporter substrate binding protein [Variovorax]|jgi:tripartite-type tricarboxylate transporter receptor subunit TctC|uniref:tripartite tricarboxylate transporter substrate binding protein n=1 Tax=Variovorax TaxID=34072 RepID=UPI00086906FF|nr:MULTISPECIES: tripartite tricarboxylate transporter substrate binding protein [Variovorax]MBN8757000.1 tripartite tricarboxylate transporter substrate binding protein [Variovorax sp.]ODU12715.1 MAG: LacI family transcriptional regulator [Variovorax sp. SCN 67-85]ODV15851.1 MAG: LacI family transcriptional regulator [Variovorax sp. SCN 67-20]OJZ09663.1 MAG: LacI family transcriptional regulator [Variovorax sp. 67-131]UKI08604.1 tripartite tricarboxylate transporter substrate binding protein 